MTKHNPANERIKREYLGFLTDAQGRDAATTDRVAASLVRFEASTRAKHFNTFHREQAVAFKARLGEQVNARTGERLSKATVHSTLRDLRSFFIWLAREPGFKSRIAYSDADYFNLSGKDTAIAQARREKAAPTVEQVAHALAVMPAGTPLQRRDRALVAFAALTGARVGALASFQLGHVDLAGSFVEQDARTVRTKAAKSFRTYFMPFVTGALEIVSAWIGELRDSLWGPGDPLFPATQMGLGADGGFVATGLSRKGWATTAPVREIFRRAFAAADLPYFNPHSFRDTLVHHGMQMKLTPEAMKALSQNIGHAHVMTTLTSYGQVPTHRQGELIRQLGAEREGGAPLDAIASLEALLASLRAAA
jgi:integrase